MHLLNLVGILFPHSFEIYSAFLNEFFGIKVFEFASTYSNDKFFET
jgi:hypothetical protein